MTDGADHSAAPSRRPASPGLRDIVLGAILLLLGLAWTITVDRVVPAGRGFGIGPRAFPFWLGVGLCVLSSLLILTGALARWRGQAGPAEPVVEQEDGVTPVGGWMLVRVLVLVAGTIAAYGFLMPRLGFLLATGLVVGATLVLALGVRRPLLVLGMTIGLPLGSWLAFGQLLGAYMPRGSWISFF